MMILTSISRSTIQYDLDLFENHSIFFGVIGLILFILAIIAVFRHHLKSAIGLGICLIICLFMTGIDDPNDGKTPRIESNILTHDRMITEDKRDLAHNKHEEKAHMWNKSKKNYDVHILKDYSDLRYDKVYNDHYMEAVHAPIFHHKLF